MEKFGRYCFDIMILFLMIVLFESIMERKLSAPDYFLGIVAMMVMEITKIVHLNLKKSSK